MPFLHLRRQRQLASPPRVHVVACGSSTHRAHVITLVERVKVKVVAGTALPQADVVAVARVTAGNGNVVGEGFHNVAAHPREGGAAVSFFNSFNAAVEAHGIHDVEPAASERFDAERAVLNCAPTS